MDNKIKYLGAFRVAQWDLGFTQNYIRQLGQDGLFKLMDDTGRKWDEEKQLWIDLAAPRSDLDMGDELEMRAAKEAVEAHQDPIFEAGLAVLNIMNSADAPDPAFAQAEALLAIARLLYAVNHNLNRIADAIEKAPLMPVQ